MWIPARRVGQAAALSAFMIALAAACGKPYAQVDGEDAGSTEGGGASSDAGGASGDGPGGGAPDAAVAESMDADATMTVDAGIVPFDTTCDKGDTAEIEPNDTEQSATPFTRVVCAALAPSTDIDWFTIDMPGTAPVTLAYNTAGNAKLSIFGPGLPMTTLGSNSTGGYRTKTLSATPPGTFYLRIDFGTSPSPQKYRLLMTQ